MPAALFEFRIVMADAWILDKRRDLKHAAADRMF